MDQPPGSLDLQAMLRDTLAALDQLSETCARFRSKLPQRDLQSLTVLEISVRNALNPTAAYNMVPGH